MTRARALPPVLRRAALILLGIAAIYAALIPFGTSRAVAMPDLVFCLLAACVLRDPRAAPLWMVLGLGLMGDLLLSRPPGLGALALVLATELLRARARLLRGAPFLVEWIAVALSFAAMLAGMEAVLRLVLAPAPGADLLMPHLVATALAYPLVVLALRGVLGLGAPERAPSALGRFR